MKTVTPNADVYTDFQGLTRLRAQARANSPEALRATAQQFEALFTQMVLKSMRQASLGEGIFDSAQSDLYRDMLDQQMSLNLSKGKGIGLADMIVKQLSARVGTPAPGAAQAAADKAVAPVALPVAPRTPNRAQPAANGAPAAAGKAGDPWARTPETFVRALWPHAQRAGRALGVAPEALLAQAALETGWGQSVITRADGRPSYNLFNIKADERWNGERLAVGTLEYENGVAVRKRAAFRAYNSYTEGFADYVNFLRDNPRYRDALAQGRDPVAFATALQDAGYATDPAYAAKIRRILDGDVLARAGIKFSGGGSLS